MSALSRTRQPWRLLGDRNFGVFWLSQAVSGFGDQLTVIGLAALVWQLTGSGLLTALVVVVTTVPHALFGFFAGPIADALGRKRALIVCDLLRTIAVGLIPVALGLGLPLGVVFGLVLVATFCAALFTPTKLAMVPDLVASDAIGSGNSLIQISDRAIEIAGKAVAGVLYLAIGPSVFYVDSVTFLVSALLLSRLALAEQLSAPASFLGLLSDAGTGLRIISEKEVLATNLLFSLFAQVGLAVFNTLAPVYVFREFLAGPDAFGGAEAIYAAGVVVFGALMPNLMARRAKGGIVVSGFALYGSVLIGLAFVPRLEYAFPLFFLGGVANAIYIIPNITIYQEHTPAEFRGRVFSTRYALLNLVWLPVMVVSGALAETMSTALLIGIAGVFTLMVAIVGWRIPAIRDVR